MNPGNWDEVFAFEEDEELKREEKTPKKEESEFYNPCSGGHKFLPRTENFYVAKTLVPNKKIEEKLVTPPRKYQGTNKKDYINWLSLLSPEKTTTKLEGKILTSTREVEVEGGVFTIEL